MLHTVAIYSTVCNNLLQSEARMATLCNKKNCCYIASPFVLRFVTNYYIPSRCYILWSIRASCLNFMSVSWQIILFCIDFFLFSGKIAKKFIWIQSSLYVIDSDRFLIHGRMQWRNNCVSHYLFFIYLCKINFFLKF